MHQVDCWVLTCKANFFVEDQTRIMDELFVIQRFVETRSKVDSAALVFANVENET